MKFSGGLGGLGLGSVSLLVVGLASRLRGEQGDDAGGSAAADGDRRAGRQTGRAALSSRRSATVDGYVNADIRARVRGVLQSQRYKDGATVQEGPAAVHDRSDWSTRSRSDSAKAAVARAETAAAHNKALLERARPTWARPRS